MWEKYFNLEKQPFKKEEFMKQLAALDRSPDLVVLASLYAHLIDQLDWKLLREEEVAKQAIAILNEIGDKYNVTFNYWINDNSAEQVISSMVENFTLLLVNIYKRSLK